MLHLPGLLTPAEVSELRQRAARAPWLDGRNTVAGEARDAKRNEQVDENSEDGRAIAALAMQAKLPAGDLVIYPSTQLHAVMPVTRGVRLACVFWVQSIVSDPLQRTLLFEMAQARRC